MKTMPNPEMRDIKIELTEPIKKVELDYERPPGKNSMLVFKTEDPVQSQAYNIAAEAVLSEKYGGSNVFQQLGSERTPGVQKWEVWEDATQEDIESAFENIQEKAAKIYHELQNRTFRKRDWIK